MVLEISMYFEKNPYRNFGTISLSQFLFTSHFAIFCNLFIEENALNKIRLGLRRRSLMVFEISMYFEKTPIGILVPFPYLNFFFTSHFAIFSPQFIEENALNKMRLV